MLAIHSFDSFSSYRKFEGLEKHNLLVLIFSVLKWKELNGKIKLFCNSEFYEWLKIVNFIDIYDDVDFDTIDKKRELIIDHSTPAGFWAASKFYAMREIKKPFFMMDIDFISFINLEYFTKQYDLIGSHLEQLNEYKIYCDKEKLTKPKDYEFDEGLDWTLDALNCSLVYHGNMDLKDEYIEGAFRFMRNNIINKKSFTENMCYIEQRYLPMLAKKRNINYGVFITKYIKPKVVRFDTRFFHLWGGKNIDIFTKKLSEKLKSRLSLEHPILFKKFKEIEHTLPIIDHKIKYEPL